MGVKAKRRKPWGLKQGTGYVYVCIYIERILFIKWPVIFYVTNFTFSSLYKITEMEFRM